MAILVLRGIVRGGVGQDADGLNLRKIAVGFQAWYFGELIYGLLTVFVRLSVALFLFQLCTNPIHKWVLTGCLSAVMITSLVYLAAAFFQCLPIAYYWERFSGTERKGHCSTSRLVPNAAIILSIVGALSDWLIALIPVAILAGVAMIARIPYIKSAALTADFLHASVDLAVWTVIEPCLGIVGGSAATFGPIFRLRAARLATRPSRSPPHTDFWTGTTVTVNGGRGNSTDTAPPPHGVRVVRKVACTRDRGAQEGELDYNRFLKAVNSQPAHDDVERPRRVL
ncbi:hypothetical protein LRP88_07356 [Fusarium phalaenopsidis]